jgi:hypothetical protein
MMGDVQGDGMAAPGFVVGHSAGGPGSVGAVYHAPELRRTAAVFTGGRDEGVAENLAVQQLFSA